MVNQAIHSLNKPRNYRLEIGLNLITMIVIVWLVRHLGLNDQAVIQNLASEHQWCLAIVLSVVLMMICAWTPLPAEAVTLVNGMVFGPLTGSLITWLSAMLGAYIIFTWSRRYSDIINHVLENNRWQKIYQWINNWGMAGFLVARLVPVVPFFALNIGAAFLPLTTRSYIVITGIAILPHIIVINYFGDYLANH